MEILDIIIIGLLIFGFFIGFKRGFIKQTVITFGFIVALVLAFIFRHPVSIFMYENLPFLKFNAFLKSAPILNILLYEAVAFIIIFSALMILLNILIFTSTIIEKILKLTIILAIPSKLLGGLVGVLHYYIIVFIGLFLLSSSLIHPPFNTNSKYKEKILTETPFLNKLISDNSKTLEEFIELKDEYKDADVKEAKELNIRAIKLMLDNKILTIDSLEKLYEKNKLDIDRIEIDLIIKEYE